MPRILDIDLDFFVEEVVYWPPDDGTRPDPDQHPVWAVDRAVSFLRDRCGLDQPVPGITVERHHEVFFAWRDLIENGTLAPPFSVTHVDAHADLGLGDAGYLHLMEDILHRPVEDRTHPEVGTWGLSEGNWLPYAIACRWLADLTFVHNDDWQPDLFIHHFDGNDPETGALRLKAVGEGEIERHGYFLDRVEVVALEPPVTYRQLLWSEFTADDSFDFICLCRSPAYAPEAADAIYDEIVRLFIARTGP